MYTAPKKKGRDAEMNKVMKKRIDRAHGTQIKKKKHQWGRGAGHRSGAFPGLQKRNRGSLR